MIDEIRLTALLQRCNAREPGAEAVLMQAMFAAFHDLACSRLRRFANSHLCPGDVVSETYLRLRWASVRWHGPAHFMGTIAQVMRNVIVDHERAQQSEKRGGGVAHVPFDALDQLADDGNPDDAFERDLLHDKIEALRRVDRRQGRMVELKILCGLTTEEIARELAISRASVIRLWRATLANLAALGTKNENRSGRSPLRDTPVLAELVV